MPTYWSVDKLLLSLVSTLKNVRACAHTYLSVIIVNNLKILTSLKLESKSKAGIWNMLGVKTARKNSFSLFHHIHYWKNKIETFWICVTTYPRLNAYRFQYKKCLTSPQTHYKHFCCRNQTYTSLWNLHCLLPT